MYNFKTLYEATSVAEALKLKADHPEALFLAGGSDILIKIREGRLDGVDLINIYMLDELRGICLEDDGSILIRPLTSFTDVAMHPVIKEHLPVLGEAVNTIGGPQVRNIGTIGGNICNGVPSADSAITLKAYDATLEIVSTEGTRILPYADFNLGFGKVDLGPTELLAGIRIPKASWENTFGHYIKYSMRKAMDIATLGCSVNVKLSKDKQAIDRLRIAFGVAAPVPVRSPKAEELAKGKNITQALIDQIGEAVLGDVNPRSSWRAGREFRLQLIEELAKRATIEAINKAGGTINV
ncbi:MAG TPA: xanthine dehydrogenase FAD-binding subunit XdhB [Sphaerochaeta sp.]|jgi:xanthine dehydrogenase FAD-binding subunit|nr:xanthine dehydrogenase FAD-binding subunit XdhB [Sphaerochaeta sp.]HPY44654.1 xanthine dehydrogenase FAD-binding subunit XdhB [Sphaerochaeta sp.]HQB04529.1 xanthine dehydrogenase FAD-binding subunit XdhB [Sphaerochaeta sp.]